MNTLSPYIDGILRQVSARDTHLNSEAMEFMNELGINLIHYVMRNCDNKSIIECVRKILTGDLLKDVLRKFDKFEHLELTNLYLTRSKIYEVTLSVYAIECIMNDINSVANLHCMESVYITHLLEYLYEEILEESLGDTEELDVNPLFSDYQFDKIITKDKILSTIKKHKELFKLFSDIEILSEYDGGLLNLHPNLPKLKCKLTKMINDGRYGTHINFLEERDMHAQVLRNYLEQPQKVELTEEEKLDFIKSRMEEENNKKFKSKIETILLEYTENIRKYNDCLDLDPESREKLLDKLTYVMDIALSTYKSDENYI